MVAVVVRSTRKHVLLAVAVCARRGTIFQNSLPGKKHVLAAVAAGSKGVHDSIAPWSEACVVGCRCGAMGGAFSKMAPGLTMCVAVCRCVLDGPWFKVCDGGVAVFSMGAHFSKYPRGR